jgi:NADPH-dependent ferric siderophore reductase
MPDFPLSSGREREGQRHETKRRLLRVIRRIELTDTLVRFTFTGDELDGFASVGPDDHVKIFFATDGEPAMRDYTPSEYRAAAKNGPELDLDFVVHGDSGPATAWASRADIGTELTIGGPRGSRYAPSGFRNAVLIADATGAPALRRWVRAFAGSTPVTAVFYGGDMRIAEYLDASERGGASLIRATDVAGGLLGAVQAADIDADTFVWAAGEATALVPVRRWLKAEKGLGKENLSLHGYWRDGEIAVSGHAPLDPSDPDD